MTKTARRVAAALAGTAAVLVATVVPSQASEASATAAGGALSCYGSAYGYWAEPGANGGYAHYPNYGQWDVVDGNCNDINIKTDSTRTVRVCTVNRCHDWKTAPKATWTVIFKNSVPGASYYLQFQGSSSNTGLLAS
ncbi:hypothetical protein ACIPJS_14820 [Streptomyces sp. NPDC086783]|uniref:hypothetical protein n=1 Tax=Streptomyces sp. NPDC086783 TaxID=3365758 RepID=UPI0037F5E409